MPNITTGTQDGLAGLLRVVVNIDDSTWGQPSNRLLSPVADVVLTVGCADARADVLSTLDFIDIGNVGPIPPTPALATWALVTVPRTDGQPALALASKNICARK